MDKIVLYHGSPNKEVVPQFELGDDRHDYGRGFYLTDDIDLAKEWAVCRPGDSNGWVHQFELDLDGLEILDFGKYTVLAWLAELMKHRDTANYDIMKGWRANASYFYIARSFVRDELDVDILEELLDLGGLGIQYCIKTEKAYRNLREIQDGLLSVDYTQFNARYNERDITARERMKELIDSDRNRVTKVFSTLI